LARLLCIVVGATGTSFERWYGEGVEQSLDDSADIGQDIQFRDELSGTHGFLTRRRVSIGPDTCL